MAAMPPRSTAPLLTFPSIDATRPRFRLTPIDGDLPRAFVARGRAFADCKSARGLSHVPDKSQESKQHRYSLTPPFSNQVSHAIIAGDPIRELAAMRAATGADERLRRGVSVTQGVLPLKGAKLS